MPKQRKCKIDRKKVKALNSLGVIPSDIARQQGVAVSTITRYLKSIEAQTADIKAYSNNKAEALCLDQLKSATVVNIIRDHWIDNPDILLSQDLSTQKEILKVAQGAKTYDHSSERLERGESTHNIASIHGDIQELKALKQANKHKMQDDDA